MKIFVVAFLLISVSCYSQNYPDDCLDSLVIPTSYSPDGDGIDDGIRIDFPCPPEKFEYAVYNRWGSLIFKTDDQQFYWPGIDEDGDPVQEGVYFWVLKYTFNGSDVSKTGSLNVLK
ncbi:MAG: gliding motility-associated C-terminal domain-containing protein [Crocinitomicaceae bacterium]